MRSPTDVTAPIGVRTLAEMLAELGDAVVIATADRRDDERCLTVVYVNRGFVELTGYAADEVVGQDPGQWAPPEQNGLACARIARALESGGEARVELRVRRKDGTWRWTEAVLGPLHVAPDGPPYFIEVSRDITDRKAVQDQLRDAQSLAQLGSWGWDIAENVVTWSDELYRIYGLDPGEFEATYEAYLARVHPADRGIASAQVQRALETRQGFAGDYRIVRSDEKVRWLHSRGHVVLDESGTPVRMVGVCQDISDQRTLEESLVHQALHDPLTTLPNRALLMDRLEHAIARAGREGSTTALLFIDLDDFKSVNDGHGHAAGDALLAAVGERLRQAFRPGDTLARHGGDEFVAVCEDIATAQAARDLASRVLTALTATPFSVANLSRTVTASVGVALAKGSDDPERLLHEADSAMYRVKSAGKDAVLLAGE